MSLKYRSALQKKKKVNTSIKDLKYISRLFCEKRKKYLSTLFIHFSRPLQSCYSLSHFYIFEVRRASEFCAGKVGGAAGSNVNKGRIDHDVELVKVVTVLPAPLKWGPIGNLGPWRRSALKGNKHWSAACIGPAHWDRRDFITE